MHLSVKAWMLHLMSQSLHLRNLHCTPVMSNYPFTADLLTKRCLFKIESYKEKRKTERISNYDRVDKGNISFLQGLHVNVSEQSALVLQVFETGK